MSADVREHWRASASRSTVSSSATSVPSNVPGPPLRVLPLVTDVGQAGRQQSLEEVPLSFPEIFSTWKPCYSLEHLPGDHKGNVNSTGSRQNERQAERQGHSRPPGKPQPAGEADVISWRVRGQEGQLRGGRSSEDGVLPGQGGSFILNTDFVTIEENSVCSAPS